MTAQEQQMLQGLIERVNGTQLAEKDTDAEQMLQRTLGPNPDATYILAQTVLVQGYALEQAQKQLADTRAQVEQLRQASAAPAPPRHSTSFLGNLLGLKEDEPTRPVAPPPPPTPQYAPVPGYAAGYGAPQGYAQPGAYGAPQQGGFLRSALQTATGVAAGALAFEGIESLMHGFGHSAGYGSGFGGGFGGDFGGGGRPEEIINNNYYGETPAAGHAGLEDSARGGLSPDIDDRRGESAFSSAVDHDDAGGNDPGGNGSGNDLSAGDDDSSFADTDPGGDVQKDDAGDASSYDDGGDSSSFDGGDSGGGDGGF